MRPHQGAETARGPMPAAHTQLRAALQGEGRPRAGEHGGDGGFGGAALRLGPPGRGRPGISVATGSWHLCPETRGVH